MSRPSRRTLVTTTASAAVLFATRSAWAVPRHSGRRDPIEELAKRILDAPRDRVFAIVEPAIRAGLDWRDLLAAVFHAGVLEVRPRPVGFKLHAVMVVESLFQVAEAGSQDERLLAAMWNLHDLKRSQERDEREGDWRLPARPDVSFGSPEAAERELVGALDAWDAERADRAIVGALAELDHERVFELLWPFAMRDFTNLGHKPIYASHVERVLARLGDARAQPALRALVYGLLDGAPGAEVDEYVASRELAAELPTRWGGGKREPARSLELARALRPASPAESRAIVAGELRAETNTDTLWDALRLVAADLFARRPELLPVHPTTVSSALRYVFGATKSSATRHVALLQAASWLPLYRAALGMDSESGGLDPLVEKRELEPVSLEALLEAPDRIRARSYLQSTADISSYAAAMRTHLLRGANEHHQPKYAAAILEDARTADARWHPALLATALEYLPSARTPDTAQAESAREVVGRLRR